MNSNGQDTAAIGGAGPATDWPGLLARHERWLRTAVYARLREPEGVEEVMQAVAVAAIEQRSPLLDLSKAAPWLYRLAVWQTLLYRRRAGRHRKLIERFGAQVAAAPAATKLAEPLAWLLADERRHLVRRALARLPRQDAEILLLKYTEDWSYRELACHLGIGESAVESRLHRARSRMRQELATENVTGETL
ncbi:MAG: RNA polymerase sigma factor [Planctomycetaceae bacterium]|nr:RNA polymerase sigma factor [Planctomycetaceae bacterium]